MKLKFTDNKCKTGNLFSFKAYKMKIKYECSADNKIFFYCNAG